MQTPRRNNRIPTFLAQFARHPSSLLRRGLPGGIGLAALLAVGLSAQDLPSTLLVDRFPENDLVVDTSPSRDVALGDIDGDGDLDAVVANSAGLPNALYLNNGTGVFALDVTAFLGSGGDTRGVSLADIDADGDLDALFLNNPADPNALFINQGGAQGGTQGDFVERTTGPVVTDNANSRGGAFADVDADGDLDLFVSNGSNNDNFMYLNQGGTQGGTIGEFAAVTVGDAVSDGGRSHLAVFGDVDGDDDLDLYVPNHGGNPGGGPGALNFLYENDGSGGFTRSLTGDAATDADNSLCADFADYDGNGTLDLFVGNNQGGQNRLYKNDGNGLLVLVDNKRLTSERGETSRCKWFDADNDGDLDLYITNRATPYAGGVLDRLFNRMFVNVGEGQFERQSFGRLFDDRENSFGLAVGDVNGDGLEDIAVANLGERNTLYRNNGSQWENLENSFDGGPGGCCEPSLGGSGELLPHRPLTLVIENGPPNAPIFYVAGLSTVFSPLRGGTLVPSPDFVGAGALTDGNGSREATGLLPGNLLSGLDLFFQAWIVDPGAVQGMVATNGVRATTP